MYISYMYMHSHIYIYTYIIYSQCYVWLIAVPHLALIVLPIPAAGKTAFEAVWRIRPCRDVGNGLHQRQAICNKQQESM